MLLKPLIGPWSQTASGRAVELLAPQAHQIDLEVDVPEHLARIARFNGACRSGVYSVAQHCVLGADALYRETSRRDMAAAFLLHDAHEYLIGDITTPTAQALDHFVSVYTSIKEGSLHQGLHRLKTALDFAIYAAAGITYPLPRDVQDAVEVMDRRMVMTERRHLLGSPPASWGDALETTPSIRLMGKLRVWPWPEAADEYRDRLKRYLPDRLQAAQPRPRPKQDTAAQKRHLTSA